MASGASAAIALSMTWKSAKYANLQSHFSAYHPEDSGLYELLHALVFFRIWAAESAMSQAICGKLPFFFSTLQIHHPVVLARHFSCR